MKSIVFVVSYLFCFTVSFAQVNNDTLFVVEYDTVIVNQPPVVMKRHVLSLKPKTPIEKESFIGLSAGVNFFSSIYSTCKECGGYDAYVDFVRHSQKATAGFNATAYFYRRIGQKMFYNAELRYSLYNERFNYDGVKALNQYHQLGLGLSLLYELKNATKNRFFIGIGGNLHYLLSASGKTVTIFKTETTASINDFRRYNQLLGGVQLSFHWLRPINERLYVLVHPEIAFEITSLTSYNEYYLQNRFLYSLNLGVLRKF